MKIICTTLEDLENIAVQILDFAAEKRVFVLEGSMGAGKTTLTKVLCKHLGVEEHTASPTFSIVNEYKTKNDLIIYHFDFYRLKNIREALDIGVEDYLFSGNYCFLEWADRITELLPDNSLFIKINVKQEIREFEIF